MTFKEGDLVGVPCSIQLGPFPDERLIAVETEDGPLAGFVRSSNLQTSDGQHGLVRGAVIDVSRDSITVKLFGSFFTTALGLASVRRSGLTHISAQ
jgi:hypothetical protein